VAKLMRGVTPAMVREGIYTASYLGLAPVVKEALRDDYGLTESTAFAGSALFAGLFAGTATHPFDTAKTRMQANLGGGDPRYASTLATFSTLLREGGVSSLYLGFVPRTLRLCMAVGVLNVAKDTISSAYLAVTGRAAPQ